MADYPSVPYDQEASARERVSSRRVLITRNRDVRSQVYGDQALYRFRLVHTWITAADRDALEAHHDAHQTATFNLTWRDGQTYVVQYDEAGLQSDHARGQWWVAQAELIGHKAP